MHNKSGAVRLTVTSIICLTLIFQCCFRQLFSNNTKAQIPTNDTARNAQTYNEVPTQQEALETSSATDSTDSSQPQSSTESSSSKAVEVSAKGEVLGAVSEKFISPYTANTSYNSVYLKNSTDLTIDLKSLLAASLPYKIEKNSAPQVLIVHTHATECFLPEARDYYTDSDLTRTLDENYNVMRLGALMAQKLNEAGISTLHDKTTHDYPAYTGSYDRAAETIKGYLKKYPSIKIVIDLHRDAIAGNDTEKVKPVATINGKKAAQVMLVMGSQSGNITNFPNWQENLKLAVRLQQQLEIMYPTLARALSLMPRLYNENLTTGSVLLEVGTEANSIEEVIYSTELVSNALIKVLNTLT